MAKRCKCLFDNALLLLRKFNCGFKVNYFIIDYPYIIKTFTFVNIIYYLIL